MTGIELLCAGRQVWIGTKQKELEAGSMQLMHQYTPWATGLLAVLVPVFEPLGLTNPVPTTILGFPYSPASVIAIAGSAVRTLCSHMQIVHSHAAPDQLQNSLARCLYGIDMSLQAATHSALLSRF